MDENEMLDHIEMLQESLDDAMEIMIKIETKLKALKRALQKHRKSITTSTNPEDRKKADEMIWDIIDYDELFSES